MKNLSIIYSYNIILFIKYYSTLIIPNLKPTICINLLNFRLIKEIEHIHTCFLLSKKNYTDYILSEQMILHFVELPKFYEAITKSGEMKLKAELKRCFEFSIL